MRPHVPLVFQIFCFCIARLNVVILVVGAPLPIQNPYNSGMLLFPRTPVSRYFDIPLDAELRNVIQSDRILVGCDSSTEYDGLVTPPENSAERTIREQGTIRSLFIRRSDFPSDLSTLTSTSRSLLVGSNIILPERPQTQSQNPYAPISGPGPVILPPPPIGFPGPGPVVPTQPSIISPSSGFLGPGPVIIPSTQPQLGSKPVIPLIQPNPISEPVSRPGPPTVFPGSNFGPGPVISLGPVVIPS